MKLLFVFLITLPFYAISQEALSFSEVIDVSGVGKNELFIRGREWFNENFKSSKDVLQITDKESGELSGKGLMEVVYTFRFLGEKKYITNVNFQMSVWVKEGKFKYEITNFIANGGGFDFGLITTSNETNITYPGFSAKKLNETYLSMKEATIAKAKLLIEDLKFKMTQKSKASEW